MDTGNEAQKRQSWAIGDRVTNSHVSHYDFCPRHARTALGGATCDDLAVFVLAAITLIAA